MIFLLEHFGYFNSAIILGLIEFTPFVGCVFFVIIQFFLSVFRHEASTGEAADPGGQRPHALGPRVFGRQVDPNHDVSVGAEKHR